MCKLVDCDVPKSGMVLLLLVAALPCVVLADIFSTPPAGPGPLEAEVLWQTQLPSSATMTFASYALLDGQIYAVGTDGSVVAVRADSGEVAWVRRLAEEGDTLQLPVSYRTQQKHAVVFTRLNDIIFVDPGSGVRIEEVKLSKPSICPAAVAPGRVFVAHANGRLSAYRLRDGYVFWRAAFDEQFSISPQYAPTLNIVVAADNVGLVAGLRNVDRTDQRLAFEQNLGYRPEGRLAVDGNMLYLSTVNQMLHAIDMHATDARREAGNIEWQYRLAKPPEDGPVLTESAIYQATVGGGLHRVAKHLGEFKNWYDPESSQFLAEWPEGVLVLRLDGSLALVRNDPARPVAVGSAGGFTSGISNTKNDAAYLTSAEGVIRCLRPAQAPALRLASFMPTTTAPAEPNDETALDRLRREARERHNRLTEKTPPPEVEAPAPAEQETAETPAPASPPPDPLRSKRPVVR